MELIVALFASGVGIYFLFRSTEQPKGSLRQALTYLGFSCLLIWLIVVSPSFSALVALVVVCALLNLVVQIYQARLAETDAKNAPRPVPLPTPPPPPEDHSQRYASMVVSQLTIPQKPLFEVEQLVHRFPPTEEYMVDSCARTIDRFFSHLPRLVDFDRKTTSLRDIIGTNLDEDTQRSINFARDHLGKEIFDGIANIKAGITLPEKIRTQHHHIVGGTGQGKTELLKGLILDDVAAGHSVVVIDSQTDMINELATKVPADRLILVDPVNCPPALNLFRADTSSELFEYIFSALDAQMTSKQATAYRFVSKMVVEAKGNIHTMRKILEPGDTWRQYSGLLGDTAVSFFESEFASRQFAETRQQILRRLFTVLENETLERMLGADENKLDIPAAIDSGKVVLVSTAKDHLKQMGASLFGRIFIAQVMQAAMMRQGNRKRTYLYIDEFQDYAEDSHVLFNLFEQARKYELGLIVAHQYLGQLPPQLTQSLAANTAIKFVGGVSTDDARKLSAQMYTTPEFISGQSKGTFAAWVRDHGTFAYPVTLGRAANTPDVSDLSAIRDDMRQRYSPLPHSRDVPKSPYSRPPEGKGSGEVPERGEWK